MSVRATSWVLVLAAACLSACATGPDVDGVWHAEAPAVGANNGLLFSKMQPKTPLGVELVVGSYGPDVAGLMRYYRTGLFDLARSPLPQRAECECAFLHSAKVDSTGRVTFLLNACVPGTSEAAPLALRGELNLLDDGRLVGTVTVDAPDQPNATVQLSFVRVATTATSDPVILDCQHPATLADGNTASGL